MITITLIARIAIWSLSSHCSSVIPIQHSDSICWSFLLLRARSLLSLVPAGQARPEQAQNGCCGRTSFCRRAAKQWDCRTSFAM